MSSAPTLLPIMTAVFNYPIRSNRQYKELKAMIDNLGDTENPGERYEKIKALRNKCKHLDTPSKLGLCGCNYGWRVCTICNSMV